MRVNEEAAAAAARQQEKKKGEKENFYTHARRRAEISSLDRPKNSKIPRRDEMHTHHRTSRTHLSPRDDLGRAYKSTCR